MGEKGKALLRVGVRGSEEMVCRHDDSPVGKRAVGQSERGHLED